MRFLIKLVLTMLVTVSCFNQVYAEALTESDDIPILKTPVVEQPKKTSKIDLKAVIFDPNAQFDLQANEENREMTKLEEAEYSLHESLYGRVEALSTDGLLADKMRMKFAKGPIESISPWIDYNGYFSENWSGPTYKNDLYGINFADVGVNIKMRDGKTAARIMISPVKSVEGRTYFQSLFADNYVTRKVSKNNTVLVGNTWLPMGFEGKESPLVWQFFNRSQTSLKYASVRTLGAKVMGNYKYVNYHIGVYSSGRMFRDFFPGPEFASWFEFKPLANLDSEKYGKLTLGAGFNGGNAESHYAEGMGGVNYEYKRLRFVTEFAAADGSNGATGFTKNKSNGFSSTLSYRLTPKLQLLGRYDVMDYNLDKANDIRREYTAGINYFIKDYAARLMLNYIVYSEENGMYGCRILIGSQIVL